MQRQLRCHRQSPTTISNPQVTLSTPDPSRKEMWEFPEGSESSRRPSAITAGALPPPGLSYRMRAGGAKSGSRGMHRIVQHANAGDRDVYRITRNDRANTRGRARSEQIAGHQGHHARDPTNQIGDRIDHQRSVTRLAQLPIHTCFDQDIAGVELCFNVRANRTKRIESFCTRKLHVAFLKVARRNIVQAGVTENVV